MVDGRRVALDDVHAPALGRGQPSSAARASSRNLERTTASTRARGSRAQISRTPARARSDGRPGQQDDVVARHLIRAHWDAQ